MNLPARAKPPIIILKLDDVSQQHGAILPHFQRIIRILQSRRIKGSCGVICAAKWPGAQPLSDSKPEYYDWIKQLHASGEIEWWFHGWDHGAHEENGELHCEFHQRSYEDQKQRFERGQKVAFEKLGFHFRTFGPGGSKSPYESIDQNTMDVVADDPHINIMFYPKQLDERAQQLAAKGKTVLGRVPGVSLERTTGIADFNLFREGYNKHPDSDYFVLQGHPNPWEESHFTEVEKILDFLQQQNATFMTPSEFAAKQKA
jgi:peptidoglycan/xylan/chitin deacetylase (PgdA/CDA1 family)